MTGFAVGVYGDSEDRLLKWDGTETEIATWDHSPTHKECVTALMDFHGTGKSPFSSREGAIDSHVLTRDWPIPIRNMRLTDETMPWNDTS